MKSLKALAVFAAIGCVALMIGGCAKKEANTQNNFQQQQQPDPQPATVPPQQQQPAPAPAPTGPVTTFDPTVVQVMSVALAVPAQKDAKGMKKEGETMGANLQEGQTMEQVVTLLPGKCYTVVGLSMPLVQDMSIHMSPVIPLPGAPALGVLSQSQTSGTQVSMAPMPSCYTNLLPMPMQAKIVVTAKSGSGPVGAQLYVK